MASFKIEWKRSTKKDLRKIPPDKVGRIVQSAEALKEDPFPDGSLKLKGSERTYRMRVGNYRIIYEVFPERDVIKIQKIRDRKDV